jgi:methylated-DNA-[protein]-cysteine S-methyltransferase
MKFAILPSDIGAILLFARNGNLSGIDVFAGGPADARAWAGAALPGAEEDPAHFAPVARLLKSYFDGAKVDLAVPVDLSGLKPFTRRVLEETGKIPYGRVATYRSIALRVGAPEAARAVGQALKRNPIPLVIPCHRVIRSDGSLGGFAMGLDIKTRLLSIEGIETHELRKSAAFF